MNRLLVMILPLFFGQSISAASTAVVNLISLSPQVFPGVAHESLTDLDWNLSVSRFPDSANNEMVWAPPDVPFTHVGYFILLDPTTFEPEPMQFVLNIPPFDDVNTNGIYDFFDPAVGVANVKTQGRRQNVPGGSSAVNFSATWNRAVDASSGTVVFEFDDLPGLVFRHDFSLLKYAGVMSYTRNSNVVSGEVAITNIVASDDTMAGPISITVTNNDSLSYTNGAWNGPPGVVYSYTAVDTLDRVGLNYVSLFEFADGYAGTGAADFTDWLLVITSSDSNTNGIPDLVENNAAVVSPSLEVVKTPAGIEIRVHGTIGQSYMLEATDSLPPGGAWQTAQTISLGANPQTVPLPAGGTARFFRLRQL